MRIKPLENWRHAGYPADTALDTENTYLAIPATNQPKWKEQGKVFVECPNGAPELCLNKREYEIAEE